MEQAHGQRSGTKIVIPAVAWIPAFAGMTVVN